MSRFFWQNQDLLHEWAVTWIRGEKGFCLFLCFVFPSLLLWRLILYLRRTCFYYPVKWLNFYIISMFLFFSFFFLFFFFCHERSRSKCKHKSSVNGWWAFISQGAPWEFKEQFPLLAGPEHQFLICKFTCHNTPNEMHSFIKHLPSVYRVCCRERIK